jgi:hypothetical protein
MPRRPFIFQAGISMKDQVAQDLLEVSKELAKTVELLNATVARNDALLFALADAAFAVNDDVLPKTLEWLRRHADGEPGTLLREGSIEAIKALGFEP